MRRKKFEVLVAGAGPVGMLTALALNRKGFDVAIIDRAERFGTHSYALGLHPASLAILDEFGLLQSVEALANPLSRIVFREGSEVRAAVDLNELPLDYPMIAVLRQNELESLLHDALHAAGVEIHWNHRLAALDPHGDRVIATVQKIEEAITGYAVAHFDWAVAQEFEIEAEHVLGTDGHRSLVRRRMGIDFSQVAESEHYAVFEFASDAKSSSDLTIALNDNGNAVLWPLIDGSFRWSFQIEPQSFGFESREKNQMLVQLGAGAYPLLDTEHLRQLIAQRAPWFSIEPKRIQWRIAVCFEKRLAKSFGSGRVRLAGDAAHTTSPIGMQSMNVGFIEGMEIADCLTKIRAGGDRDHLMRDLDARQIQRWRELFGLAPALTFDRDTPDWIKRHQGHLAALIPGSGDALAAVCAELGCQFENSAPTAT